MKFNFPIYTTNYFSTKVLVKCPKCKEKAIVTSKPSSCILPLNNEAKIQCTSCSFQQENTTDWNGYCQGFFKDACGFCGTKMYHSTKPTKETYKKGECKMHFM
jgi:hypothetical protein